MQSHPNGHFDPERVTLFAQTDARGSNVPFGIKAKDRTKHMYVIGKTGMGKSTMLENMAVQDIQNGEGLAFMDPHGATAEKLLEYIPEHRIKDVLYFAPFDMQNPVSFNVMEDVGPDKRHLVVSGLMSIFKKIWIDAWSGRMEYILSNTILALLEYPDATLLGVNRMLSDKDYRNAVVANVKDPSVRSFWVDEFAKYNERYMQEAGDAIKNKIGQFTMNPLIRNIIGQPKSSFDIRQMIEERKIVIINLSKGLVGETNANLLGSMFITRIYLAAMSRADMSPHDLAKAPNFYLYVDEFQSFANETFANILSEARKYKLNLTIAHQYIEQMEDEVKAAVFGNVGTTISFRVGPFDAEVLETVFAPQFTAMDVVNLGFAQIYLTLMIDGIGSKPFSATTLPPIAHPAVSNVDRVIASSRAQYAKSRAEVEAFIEAWHEPVKKPAPAGRIEEGAGPKAVVRTGTTGAALRNGTSDRPVRSEATRTAAQGARPVRSEGSASAKIERTSERTVERASPRTTEERPQMPKEERRDDRGGDRRQNRDVAPRPNSEKHLEDLRSILGKIAKVEPKPEAKSTEHSDAASQGDTHAMRELKEKTQQESSPDAQVSEVSTSVQQEPSTQTPVRAAPEVPSVEAAEREMTREELEALLRVHKERPPV